MESDGYALFTECHRLYIQGIRSALRERLELAYGDDWFRRGVLSTLTDNQRENLDIAWGKEPDSDPTNLLDAVHFGRIISWNHAAVFSEAFTEIDLTLSRFRVLASIRNDWAHIPPNGIPLPRAIGAIQVMKDILVRLRRREAVEIDAILSRRNVEKVEKVENPMLEPVPHTEDSDNDEDGGHLDEPTTVPLALWRTFQSYLITESFIEPGEARDRRGNQLEGQVLVTVRASNIAPASEDRPDICFRDVNLVVVSSQRGQEQIRLGDLEPGRTVERQFAFFEKEVAQFEFQVSGHVDPERYFRIQRKDGLPGEVVRPILNEFVEQFEAIGIKEPLSRALATITDVQPTMTLADASRIRRELGQVGPIIKEKQDALNNLFREFHLSSESPLGAQTGSVALFLNELGPRIQAVDGAIGDTNLEAMEQAVNGLEQLQLSVLQVEETIRRILNA